MENASRWIVSSGSATNSTNSAHTQGSYSLSVTASNVVSLKGSAVSKPSDPLSSVLGIDVMVPTQAGSTSWGTVQLAMDSPALQIWGQYLGQVILAQPKGVWQTIGFQIPPAVYTKLAANSFSDLTITLTLNPNGGNGGAFLFDNLRFLPVAGCAGQANGTACDDAIACTTGATCGNGVCGTGAGNCDFNAAVRGFETPRAWTVSNGTASLMPSTTKREGNQALSVVAPFYSTFTSIQIATEPMVGKQMGLWLQIPTSQPNSGWHGEITLNLKALGLNIDYSQTVALLPYATGTWVELTFTLPDSAYTAMATHLYGTLYYAITINPPNGQTGAYLFDDLHFQPVSSCAGVLNTTACEDGSACTAGTTCFNGTCGTVVNCDDGNVCTTDSCNPATGCVHTNNTVPCDDRNACTTQDTCSNGACVGGPPPNCDDANVCTDDSCTPATGCVHANNTAPCDDSNACTTQDTCSNGACVGGPPPNCNDANVCTDDSCNPATGCVHTNNTVPCDDGNACTTQDTCSNGSCAGGPPPNCNDSNVCTDDSCNPATGCVHTNNTAPCNDGNLCTTADTCLAGRCVGGPPPNCDDGSACTKDVCVPATGCVHQFSCSTGQICSTSNSCCTPKTCADIGAECGSWSDNCGHQMTCGTGNCVDPQYATCNPAGRCVQTGRTNRKMGVNICEMLLEDLVLPPTYDEIKHCDLGTWDWKCVPFPQCCLAGVIGACWAVPECYWIEKVLEVGQTILAGNIYCSITMTPSEFFEKLGKGVIQDLNNISCDALTGGLTEFHEGNVEILRHLGRNVPANARNMIRGNLVPNESHFLWSDLEGVQIVSGKFPTAGIYLTSTANAITLANDVVVLKESLYNALFDSANANWTYADMLTNSAVPNDYIRAVAVVIHELVHTKQYRELGQSAFLCDYILRSIAGTLGATNSLEQEAYTWQISVSIQQGGRFCHVEETQDNADIDAWHLSLAHFVCPGNW
jgi:hypothetical protein